MSNKLLFHIYHIFLKLLYCKGAITQVATFSLGILAVKLRSIIFDRHRDDLIHVFAIKLIQNPDIFKFVFNNCFLQLDGFVDVRFKLSLVIFGFEQTLFESCNRIESFLNSDSKRILVVVVPALLRLLNEHNRLSHGINLRLLVSL